MSEPWNSILTGAVGGLIVLIIQEVVGVVRKRNEKKNDKIIKPRNSNKIITDSVLYDLRPGANIELMRELLGTPVRSKKVDNPIFS